MTSRSTIKHPVPVDSDVDLQSMEALIRDHWKDNRTAVSPATDRLAQVLQKATGGEIIEARSGSEALTWITPKNWVVRSARLETLDGEVLADFAENPLHLWTHSVPFRSEVDRADLIENHVYTDPARPDEIPYHYRNGFRYDAKEWGFSLPYRIVEQMDHDSYFVEIDADLDDEGSLKVVDAFLPGENEDTILIAAHTCHPAQVSDGLANVAVAIDLFNHLQARESRRWSYRFIFGPEYFGAAAYLENGPRRAIEMVRFALYLDFLSSHEPMGFQHSMQKDTRIDRIVKNVLETHTGIHIEAPYRELVGNDETFYNGPGFGIPTIGIARSMHREYHFSSDTPENMNRYHLVEAAWILRRIVEVLETDFVPIRKFMGPLYLSRYDLYVDPTEKRTTARDLEKLHAYADGEASCMEIADRLGLDFFKVHKHFQRLHAEDLISMKARGHQADDAATPEERGT